MCKIILMKKKIVKKQIFHEKHIIIDDFSSEQKRLKKFKCVIIKNYCEKNFQLSFHKK